MSDRPYALLAENERLKRIVGILVERLGHDQTIRNDELNKDRQVTISRGPHDVMIFSRER